MGLAGDGAARATISSIETFFAEDEATDADEDEEVASLRMFWNDLSSTIIGEMEARAASSGEASKKKASYAIN